MNWRARADDARSDKKPSSPARPRLSLKARALTLLARRDHSRRELARKLAPHAPDPETLEALLDELAGAKYLSDERYARSLIHRQAPRLGNRRIAQTLGAQGVDADTVAQLTQELCDTEEDRARAVWQKKFGTPPADAREYARQMRFMTYRGFAPDVLRRIIDDHACGEMT